MKEKIKKRVITRFAIKKKIGAEYINRTKQINT
jgi:hypothetical protein